MYPMRNLQSIVLTILYPSIPIRYTDHFTYFYTNATVMIQVLAAPVFDQAREAEVWNFEAECQHLHKSVIGRTRTRLSADHSAGL